jgi:hypothetical protein
VITARTSGRSAVVFRQGDCCAFCGEYDPKSASLTRSLVITSSDHPPGKKGGIRIKKYWLHFFDFFQLTKTLSAVAYYTKNN